MKSTCTSLALARSAFPNPLLSSLLVLALLCGSHGASAQQAKQTGRNVIPAAQVPTLINSRLSPANLNSNGAAQSLTCQVIDEADVIYTGDGNAIEVDHCDADGGSPEGGGGGSASTEGAPSGGASSEDCSLFATELSNSCAALTGAAAASCRYNACAEGASCEEGSKSQCGPKPKPTSKDATVAGCMNQFTANFNFCSSASFPTTAGQNACLFGATSQLKACVASKQQIAVPLGHAPAIAPH